ncbi:MAG: HpcH/HpaI aldolase/citrate lyase family protein [Bacteroidales bacterium]|jgi:citrate lyase subunit beta/citryl-CoA lyase|nr:HpcH/HpaI aldolase/citrate lyase family protein [Bacteroidales bacterium]
MNNRLAVSGNSGPKVRSDCQMELELTDDGGIVFDLKSKVMLLYGESIKNQCLEILEFYGIRNAILKITDSGALPFVISARIEAAVKQLVDSDKEFLPEIHEDNKYPSKRDRFRFSRLYVPGNTPSMMINAGLHSADGIILDLEDSVAPEKKDEARILVRNALRQICFYGAERMVRINQGERGLKDLEYVIPHYVNLILIPKCESKEEVKRVESKINELRNLYHIDNEVYLMPIIESAAGVEMSFEIARSSDMIVAIAIGLEDLTADLGVTRTKEGSETLYARMRIVNAAKAAGIQPIDSVFSDIGDMEALRLNVLSSKSLGFEGMGCIHPRQVPVVRQGFAPGPEEIEKSRKIVLAYDEARRNGLGVVALGTKMIDQPVVARAQRTVDLAVSLGLMPGDWKNDVPIETE